ncbi:MAG: glycoside hydrolase family 3 N-terminal domain-containing protein [Actinomycetales bacterium]
MTIAVVAAAGLAAAVVFLGAPGLFRSAHDGVSQGPLPATSGSGAPTTAAAPPSSAPLSATPTESVPAPAPAPTSAPTVPVPTKPPAQQVLAALTPEQRIGQVLMVSSPVGGADANTLAALDLDHVGNVFLKGRSYAGSAAAASVVAALRTHASAAATGGVKQFIATDQEGGLVQILNGPGFSAMPSALQQGTLAPGVLRGQAAEWGRELAAAGINVNFAPVMDTVPSAAFAPSNIPIGHYNREFGFTPAVVSSHGTAFAQGMADAGVLPVVKHFPGLGRVTANTDTSTAVTDSITVRNDPYVQPFRDAVQAVPGWVMASNAYYPAIDPDHIAPFSPVVLRDMIRGDLNFTGIVVSDDLCDAVQLSPFNEANRAADFIAAGGTMALCTNQAKLPVLYQGMLDRYRADPAFAKQVDAAALLVLTKKAGAGLLGP